MITASERVKQICLELKISMRSFLNIRIKILRNSLKNIRDAVFNLITLQTKGLQLYWKGTMAYALFVERRQTATSETSSKNQNSSTG